MRIPILPENENRTSLSFFFFFSGESLTFHRSDKRVRVLLRSVHYTLRLPPSLRFGEAKRREGDFPSVEAGRDLHVVFAWRLKFVFFFLRKRKRKRSHASPVHPRRTEDARLFRCKMLKYKPYNTTDNLC